MAPGLEVEVGSTKASLQKQHKVNASAFSTSSKDVNIRLIAFGLPKPAGVLCSVCPTGLASPAAAASGTGFAAAAAASAVAASCKRARLLSDSGNIVGGVVATVLLAAVVVVVHDGDDGSHSPT